MYKIEEVEWKVGKDTGNKYLRAKINDGSVIKWASVFQESIIEFLNKNVGNEVSLKVEPSNDGKFLNIRGFGEPTDSQGNAVITADIPKESVLSGIKKPTETTIYSKPVSNVKKEVLKQSPYQPTTMYVSYAKDLTCSMINSGLDGTFENLMQKSIEMIKLAHAEFS